MVAQLAIGEIVFRGKSAGGLKRRRSAADMPSGSVLAGICRRSSARNGSSSDISISLFRRQISISTGFLERREQEIPV